jgi:hypothetical protein
VSEIDWYVYWVILCGIVLNAWLALKLGRVAGHLIYAAIAACSFTRFAWACGREHGFRPMPCPRWLYAPAVWFDIFVALSGGTKGSVTHMGGAGVWRGIGNWTVFPRKEAA